MEQAAVILMVAVAFAAATWFQYRLTRGRMWRPLPIAFTLTAFAGVCLVSGLIGYNISKHSRSLAGTSWSPTIIWWEVGVGLALMPAALYFWRRGLRSVESIHTRP